MRLLERADDLALLGRLADEARAGTGSVVLVAGEAGIGKTSVVQGFLDEAPPGMRCWIGACDPLDVPAPLAPFVDIAEQDRRVQALLDDPDPHTLAPGIVRLLTLPTVLVVEDVHWMDDATADVLVHVARRIARTQALVLITRRDGPSATAPALARFVEATTTAARVHHHRLHPLTPAAVSALAAHHSADGPHDASDAGDLHAVTGGNPFFVTELLAAGGGTVPAAVEAVVLSRVRDLSEGARELVDLVSLAPGAMEVDTAEWVLGSTYVADHVDEAVERGPLRLQGGALRFRHDLAREAVARAVAPSRRLRLDREVLLALELRPDVDAARLAHHAARAGDEARLRTHAPVAARAALRRHAHRAAVAHVDSVLDADVRLPPVERAELLELLFRAREPLDEPGDVLVTADACIDAWGAAGEPLHRARCLAMSAGLHHRGGDAGTALRTVTQAYELIDGLPVDENVATVLSMRTGLLSLVGDVDEARRAATRALETIDGADAPWASSRILMHRAIAHVRDGEVAVGLDLMRRSVDLARARIGENVAFQANLAAETLVEHREPDLAMEFVSPLLDDDRYDVPLHRPYALITAARLDLQRGDIAAAERRLDAVTVAVGEPTVRCLFEVVRATCRARRGQVEASSHLDAAVEAVGTLPDLAFRWPIAAARAEHAWLTGETDVGPATSDALALARQRRHPWAVGELLYWRSRAGLDDGPVPEGVAPPWRSMVTGRWRRAAEQWEDLGAPYERALALGQGDGAAQRMAIELLDDLGAVATADRIRARLRADGITDVPSRPRSRGAPLTDRQQQVLWLVAEGLTDAQIAGRLSISSKTVGHHVSAILARMDVRSRTEAAAVALRDGLLEG